VYLKIYILRSIKYIYGERQLSKEKGFVCLSLIVVAHPLYPPLSRTPLSSQIKNNLGRYYRLERGKG
jgi:hypothetical protein